MSLLLTNDNRKLPEKAETECFKYSFSLNEFAVFYEKDQINSCAKIYNHEITHR